jgi:molecular chaperone GrpE
MPRLEIGATRPKFDKMQEETVQPQDKPQASGGDAANRSLEELLAETQAKLEQQRDQTLRTLADTENMRKRLQAEAASAQKYALEGFVKGLLPVVDSLEAALKSADVSGIEVIVRQLRGALEKAGVQPVDPAPGERVDPHREKAMAAVEADGEANTIVAVMQKGYTLHDRVLRPALVTVAKPRVEKDAGNPISDTDLD